MLLHWMLWTRVPASPVSPEIAARAPIEFSVIEPKRSIAPPPPPPSAATPPAEPSRKQLQRRSSAVSASAPAIESVPGPPPMAAGEATTLNGPNREVNTQAPAAAPTAFSLSPRSAANTLANALAPKTDSVCGSRAGPAAVSCEPKDDRAASAQAELNRTLKHAAQDHPYLVQREPPSLQRDRDGSYSFVGPVFHAKIALDGHVSFEDKGQVRLGTGGAQIGFDLTDAVDSLSKHELYSAEKQWFLDETVALRDQLANAFQIAERARTKRELERALARIVDSEDDVPRKRAAVFALWQDCGADADGDGVRRVVELFIRSKMPEGSPLGFSAEEIEHLNRNAATGIRFDPYRS
ncbi:MAG TPA: hypothetical protein VGI70_13400 [Polyangiales bacterium]